ncbi:recombinase family protein [Mycobacterium helveticum]|uniref:recombinase family protein n=1 Tax=Mycobacterium helveticum TaxID=2592811 RepID=UPI003CCC482E
MLVGYARCSTDAQDLTVQRDALTALGVKPNRISVDQRSDQRQPGASGAARGAGRNMVRRAKPKPDPDNPQRFLPNGARAKSGLNCDLRR